VREFPREYDHCFLGNGTDGVLLGYSGAMVPERVNTPEQSVWYKSDRYYPPSRPILPVPHRHYRKEVTRLPDPTDSWFEGTLREAYVRHRRREWRARRAKIRDALERNRGRLRCEVKRCGFDFRQRYGPLGEGFAEVHHRDPLSAAPKEGRQVSLDRLAIVCANCHRMIHVGGKSRSLKGLIS